MAIKPPVFEQSGGDDSQYYQTPNQIVVHNYGMSPAETVKLVRDLVKADLEHYAAAGRLEADRRMTLFESELLARFEVRPELTSAMEDPDVQHYTAESAKGFIRMGPEASPDLLLDLLEKRCEQRQRSLTAAIFDQALQVTPLLTDEQLDILTITWLVTRVRLGHVYSVDALSEKIRAFWVPFSSRLPDGEVAYSHLDFLRCATVSVLETKLYAVLPPVYPGLFTTGVPPAEVPAGFIGGEDEWKAVRDTYMTRCLRNPENIQVNALNKDQLAGLANVHGAPPELLTILETMQQSNLMSAEEVNAWLSDIHPHIAVLVKRWEETPLQHLRLTSVGLAIAHTNAKRVTGFDADIKIWLE